MRYVFLVVAAGHRWEVVRDELATGAREGGHGSAGTYGQGLEIIRSLPSVLRA